MLFRQSATSRLTRESVVEEAARIPDDIYAALIGSGEIGLGLDGTGMQGMNTRLRDYRDTASLMYGVTMTQDDLCIRRDSALSKHDLLAVPLWNPETNFLLLPCGWLDYTLRISDEIFDTARIAREATDWRREFSPLTGIVETRFRLGKVQVAWKAGVAPDRVEVDFAFEAASLDGRSRRIGLSVRCHQTTRLDRPLATGGLESVATDGAVFRAWNASNETSTAALLEPIRVTWLLVCDKKARYEAAADFIASHFEGRGRTVKMGLRLVTGSDRNGTETKRFALGRAAAFRKAGAEAALADVAARWRRFFAGAADVRLGDPMKEFLVLQSQYLMRAGCGWRKGLPMSTLFTTAILPATYWDSFFTADGMLRCGHVELVRDLCAWLVGSALPKGRPHYWMTHYNGRPVETYDEGYQVILAFGGIFIRLYECTRDRADLKDRAYPYLRKVAEYAFDELLAKEESGWRLKGAVAHDVDVGASNAEKHPGMLLWVAVCISKCAQYAAELGVDDPVIAKCRDLDRHFRAHPINLSDPGMWGLWLPFLTAAEPLADFASWARTARKRLAEMPARCYLEQPWANFVVAASLSMTGQPDLALEVQRDGLNSISGLGYIDEVTYESHGGGWAPFPTATGPWLSSVMIGLAHGSLWNDDVEVCTRLPKCLAHQYLAWRNILTFNGARVSGSYDPHRLEATVETARPRRVRLRVPARIAGEPIRVRLGAQPVDFEADGETVVVRVSAGKHRLSVERDLAAAAKVIVAEPFDHGRELAALVETAGGRVRWMRDYETLKRLAAGARAVVVHVSYASLPADVVAALERAVRDEGLTVIGLFHAGCINLDLAMAELTGARATFDGTEREYWVTTSSERTYVLTDEGKQRLPSLPHELRVPAVGRFAPNPAKGVAVLATEGEGGPPVVTLRRLGKGRVYWIAAGCKTMDFGNLTAIHSAGKNLWLFGEDPQDKADLKWLRSPDWRRLFLALVKTAL